MMEAAQFYESQQTDLGKHFLSSVQAALNQVQINPLLYPAAHLDVRRCITKTFPFSVLYRIAPDQIIVMAVMHQRRQPDYWKRRKNEI
ncbi:MAG: type II toxin-antitoxin system RelE/ParE family toxin [Kiritimatiellales bacterium]|nr:type II toxin-antitoxin system RelE/ParE family toxin [Kiritimatiellales bacterium]